MKDYAPPLKIYLTPCYEEVTTFPTDYDAI